VQIQTFDWIAMVILALVFPVFGMWKHRRLEGRVARAIPNARTLHYRQVLLIEWSTSIVLFLLWRSADRGWSELGFGTSADLWTWIGWGVTAAVIALLVVQTVAVLRDAEKIAAVRQQVEPLRALIPTTPREARLFNWVSLSAGICEEFLYRGYAIAVLAALSNVWMGVLISSVIFGLGHAYQGPKGIAKTGLVGLAMAGLYQLTGSLWAPMLLHAAVDVNSGYLGRRALATREPSPDVRAAA